MTDGHRFTMIVERDPFSNKRFRWAFCVGGEIRAHSPESSPTKRQAHANAEKTLKKRAELWQGSR